MGRQDSRGCYYRRFGFRRCYRDNCKGKLDEVYNLFCTKDPIAEEEFRLAAHPSWNIYMDHFYMEYLPFRMNRTQIYGAHSYITEDLNGKPGLWALGSLLGAMEANFFVLTTISNWSRLLNELRTNAMDSRCCGCTYMIDLQEGEFYIPGVACQLISRM